MNACHGQERGLSFCTPPKLPWPALSWARGSTAMCFKAAQGDDILDCVQVWTPDHIFQQVTGLHLTCIGTVHRHKSTACTAVLSQLHPSVSNASEQYPLPFLSVQLSSPYCISSLLLLQLTHVFFVVGFAFVFSLRFKASM